MLLFIASALASITSHTHSWVLILLWFHPFILSGFISPHTYQPEKFIFQCPIFLLFHTVHVALKVRILKWFAIPFSSGPHSVRPLHHDLSVLGGPTHHGFTELDKAVAHVIRLASSLWLWFQSVCPLMPSLSAYHLTWVSLTLDVGYLFLATSPVLLPRVSPHSHLFWLWTWGSTSHPPIFTLDVG